MDQVESILQFAFGGCYAALAVLALGILAWALRTRRPSARRIMRSYRALGLEGDFEPSDNQAIADLAADWERAAAQRGLGEGIGGVAGVLTSLFVALSLPIGPTRLTPEPVVRAALLAFLGLPGWTVGMLAGRYIAVIGPAGLRRRTATADIGDGLEPGPWFLRWRRIATLVYTAVAGLDAVITAIATSAIVTQIHVASTERPLVVAYAAFLAAFPVLLAVALVIEARLRRSMSRLPDDILARHQDLPQQVRERFMAHAKPQSSTYALSISFFILLSQTMIMMQVIGAQRVFYPLFNVLLGCSMAHLLLNVASWIPLWISTLSRTGPNRIGMGATGAG